MKLVSIRCGICDEWMCAHENHCKKCGATRMIIHPVTKRRVYLDYEKLLLGQNREMVRGAPSDLALRFSCER